MSIYCPWALKRGNTLWFQQSAGVISALGNRVVWNNTKITWHVVIQAVESLLWIGLAASLSPWAWIKGLPHFQNPCIDLIQTMCIPIDTQLSPQTRTMPCRCYSHSKQITQCLASIILFWWCWKVLPKPILWPSPLSSPHCCLWQGAALGLIPENLPGIHQA